METIFIFVDSHKSQYLIFLKSFDIFLAKLEGKSERESRGGGGGGGLYVGGRKRHNPTYFPIYYSIFGVYPLKFV